MTPARWQQIEELYLAAKERDPAARDSFLSGACGEDKELRAKVEAMLAQDESVQGILDRAPYGGFADLAATEPMSGGAQLGPYRIEELMGEGGMGKVYRARDTRLGRPVAIKILSTRFEARFEREARAISALNHPHICILHDIGVGYLVMELIEGETLASHLRKGALSLDLVLRYGSQIASALAAAHTLGIVHRDLKPGNIMLGKNGVKVLDFGIAKFSPGSSADPPSESLSGSQAVLGTPSYMAPEQLEGQPCDARSDIFSLGLVLYEMATGRRAFSGGSQAALTADLLRCEPPPLDGLPARLAHVIERCLSKDPEARWQSAADVKLELEWCATRPAGSGETRNQVPPGVRRWLWPSVAAVVIAAAVGLALVQFRQAAPEPRVVRSTVLPPDKTSFDFLTNLGPVALSPDGRRMVFAATAEDGKSQLWIRALDATAAQPLPGTAGGRFPFWSPDSRWVAFFGDNKLKKIDTQGGPPIELADSGGDSNGGSWGAGGTIVFAPASRVGVALMKISSTGDGVTPATAVDAAAGIGYHSPWFLPDGEHFLFAALNPGGDRGRNLMVGSLRSTVGKLIGSADSNAIYAEGRLLYLRSGTLMAQPFDVKALRTAGEAVPVAEGVESLFRPGGVGVFSASQTGMLAYHNGAGPATGDLQLTWFDRNGRPLGTIGEPRQIVGMQFSPDRRSLVAVVRDAGLTNADLWTYDMERALPTRFTSDGLHLSPRWSADGQTIAFSSTHKGHYDLYRKPANGSGVEELLYADDQDKIPSGWSPDGKFLLYNTVAGSLTGADQFVLPLTPEHPGAPLKSVPFLQTKFQEGYGLFSPDGRWVAYVSNESQQNEVYVAPFSRPAEKHQISPAGGTTPRWRQDGKEIFYVAPDGQLMAAEVRIGEGTVEVGAVRTLLTGIQVGPNYLWDVSADGQRILAAVPVANRKAPEPITLVENWTSTLKK